MRLHQESLLLFRMRHLRETYCFLCANCLSTLAWIFSRRYRRWRRGIQLSCIISQRKTGCSLFSFMACLRLSAWSAWDLLGFICANRLSTLAWIFSRRLRRWRRGMQQAALYRRERQVVWGCCSYCYFVVLGFVCVNLRDLRETLGFLLSTLMWGINYKTNLSHV